MTEKEIDHLFTYHPPNDGQAEKYDRLRAAGHFLAMMILELVPPGADQSAAIRKVREAIMTANAGIACGT